MKPPFVEKSVVVDVGSDVAWQALVEPDGLSEWFGATARVERIEPGSHIEFSWEDGAVRGVTIEEVVPGRRLAFRWMPFVRTTRGPVRVPGSRVEIDLEEERDGTRITVRETGTDVPAVHETIGVTR
ncbi:MAG: SRPBCC domain-containing protein [Actinomycetota bacterium]|nr:SRPBCC domain-containing protein [Actinomycetota bacterium]